jgi:hypothetical protein
MIQAPNPRPLVASSVVREEGGSLEHLNFADTIGFRGEKMRYWANSLKIKVDNVA